MKMWKVSYENASPVEVEAEIPSWPNCDSNGDKIFDNTHFLTLEKAWEKQLKEQRAGFYLSSKRVRGLRDELTKAEKEYVEDSLLYRSALEAHRAYESKRNMQSETTMNCCNRPHSQCECPTLCEDCHLVIPGKLMMDTNVGLLCLSCSYLFFKSSHALVNNDIKSTKEAV